mmetsp:Transcript_45615/g.145560  ORF Transcript_45615/g.145560 Transcript_45615/m.145560 type:complete len:206 (-) Transcript_45615:4-621(-)
MLRSHVQGRPSTWCRCFGVCTVRQQHLDNSRMAELAGKVQRGAATARLRTSGVQAGLLQQEDQHLQRAVPGRGDDGGGAVRRPALVGVRPLRQQGPRQGGAVALAGVDQQHGACLAGRPRKGALRRHERPRSSLAALLASQQRAGPLLAIRRHQELLQRLPRSRVEQRAHGGQVALRGGAVQHCAAPRRPSRQRRWQRHLALRYP